MTRVPIRRQSTRLVTLSPARPSSSFVLPDELIEPVLDAIETTAHTGNLGDGKILVYRAEEGVKIRNGPRGRKAG